MDKTGGTDELNIQHAILTLMRDGRVWSNAELKQRLARTLPLTQDDRKMGESGKRPNEARWENRINNSLSPSRTSSLYSKGHVENVGHGLHRITTGGRSYINEDDIDPEDLINSMV